MAAARARVLVVDDDPSFLQVLTYIVEEAGHAVDAVMNGEEALRQLAQRPYDLLITDLRMPGMSGEELVARTHAEYPELPILVITAYAEVESTVHVMRHGAWDLITKPLQRDLFRHTLTRVLERRTLRTENAELRRELGARSGIEGLVATSPAMAEVLDLVRRVAPSDATLLITGESGTGKEVIARALHTLSARADMPFVAVNCAAIPRELLESELFGHTKGAFTGATRRQEGRFLQANKGTLFLDEVGSLPEPLQAKLLRVLQEREVDLLGGSAPIPVDVRIIAATNTDLEAAVEDGRFRADLFYRLNVIALRVPPLRERPDDILPLARQFLAEFGAADVTFGQDVETALLRYDWPGNVRELQNVCQRFALLRRETGRVTVNDLPGTVRRGEPRVRAGGLQLPLGPNGLTLAEAERLIIEYGLEQTGWNQTRAAKFLGISRQTLIYRMRKFGLAPDERKEESA